MSKIEPTQRSRIKHALGKYAQQRLDEPNFWPVIEQQAQTVTPLPANRLLADAPLTNAAPQPRRRFATLVTAAAVILALAVLAAMLLPALGNSSNVAALPGAGMPNDPVNRAPNAPPAPPLYSTPYTTTEEAATGDENLMTAYASKHAQPISLTQTINGYSLTIKKVYADANIIVVRCTVDGPRQAMIDYTNLSLTSNAKSAASNGVMGNFSDKRTASDCVLDFNPADMSLNQSDASFHLVANLNFRPQPSVSDGPEPTKEPVAGPFIFDFNVAVDKQIKVIAVGKTMVAGGIPLTVERLVITPGQTRVIVRYPPPDSNIGLQWHPVIALDGADWASHKSDNYKRYQYNSDLRSEGAIYPQTDGSSAYILNGNLYDKVGNWQVTVKELYSVDKQGNERHHPGPWTFSVTVSSN